MLDTFGIMDYRSFGGGDTASLDISYIMYTSRTCILYNNMISIYVIISLLLYFTHGSAKHMQDHMAFRKNIYTYIYIPTRIIIICTTRR